MFLHNNEGMASIQKSIVAKTIAGFCALPITKRQFPERKSPREESWRGRLQLDGLEAIQREGALSLSADAVDEENLCQPRILQRVAEELVDGMESVAL